MDITTLFIGIVVGLLLGAGLTYMWASSVQKANSQANNSTEAELKSLLAEQANSHLRTSSETIERISGELNALKTSMMQYEQSLSMPLEDESRTTFFGEHASLFLRNSPPSVTKSANDSSTGDQPRDFSNGASGLFVGHPDVDKLPVEEKSNN
jgi:uncharacterized membrane-anchored protein YhcB (DUF1043 family)